MRRPIGIAIIAILNFLSGIYLILVGLGVAGAAGYSFFGKKVITEEQKEGLLGVGTMGVIALVIGILTLIIAIALWRLKTWAWYLAFLFAALHLCSSLYTGIQHGFSQDVIIHAVIYGLFTLYLLAVKKHFGKK